MMKLSEMKGELDSEKGGNKKSKAVIAFLI